MQVGHLSCALSHPAHATVLVHGHAHLQPTVNSTIDASTWFKQKIASNCQNCSTCGSCAFVEVSTPFKFNRSAVCGNQETSSLSGFLDFTLSVSIVETEDSSQIVCTGVVLDLQILQIRILDFRFLQIRQLAVVGDPGTIFNTAAFTSGLSLVHPGGLTVCRPNLRESHHSTSV